MPPRFRINELRRLHPKLKEIRVSFTETGDGLPDEGKKGELSFLRGNLVGHVPCANPDCDKGGYELTGPLKPLLDSKKTEGEFLIECPGRVGSRRSEKGPASCPNQLKATVEIRW